MIDKRFIYAGPSWARKSYDDVGIPETNLLKQWKLEDSAIDISRESNTFNNLYNDLLSFDLKPLPPELSDLPVIYITCEPLAEWAPRRQRQWNYLGLVCDETFFDNETEGICDVKDVMKFRENIHENHMNILRDIKNPVAIIGAHTDVSYTDVSNSNNRIIDLSWQNFLLREANIQERYNFGADIIHTTWYANDCKIKDQSILEKVHSQFEVWDSLEELGLMYGPHPTRKGNELYAEYTYDKVQEFINDNT